VRPIGIAHVLSSFEIGGQERVALDLAAGQRALGHRVIAVSLAAPPDGALAADFAAAGVATDRLDKGGRVDLTLPGRLARLFARERVDVVHTHNPQPLIYGAPAAKLFRPRRALVHTKHGANPEPPRRVWLRRAAGRLADAVVAVSDVTAEVARRNRECAPTKLHTITNGIDLGRFHPDPAARAQVRAELGIPAAAWVVGTVGRLSPEKDQRLLVRAIAPLLRDEVRLVLVGEGEENERLRRLAGSIGSGGYIHFLGARRDVPRVLAALDLFALPSRTEGLPLVLIEAMATGLVVVATEVGGIPTLIEPGVTGFLVGAGDADALAERLRALAFQREVAETCGGRALQVARARCSREAMVEAYMRLYEQIAQISKA
jgi:glycosyltransferase involved in cell wall biosynthesis